MKNHLANQVLDHEMLNRVKIHLSHVNFSNMNLTLCDCHKMKAHDLQLGNNNLPPQGLFHFFTHTGVWKFPGGVPETRDSGTEIIFPRQDFQRDHTS